MKNMTKHLLAAAIAATVAMPAFAAVSADEAAKLGKSLTPMGAEQAGNAAGTIPAWTGGLTTAGAGFKTGNHYKDPYNDKPLFTITAANADKYKDSLTPGQMAMLKKYADWKLVVYPTRRSSSFPKGHYDETMANALS